MLRNTRIILTITGSMLMAVVANGAELRSVEHDKYARKLWTYVNGSSPWTNWTPAVVGFKPTQGPLLTPNSHAYVNSQGWADPNGYGALIVARHYDKSGPKAKPVAVSVWYRVKKGYNPKSDDWYWAHYLPNGTVVATSVDKNPHTRRGFVTFVRKDRLWVFSEVAPQLGEFLNKGKLAKPVVRLKAGPNGIPLAAPDDDTINRYLDKKSA